MSKFSQTNIFTTGQVAKICQVAPRTVTKWFDSGQLKGYRIPVSQDRRIPRTSLVEFLSDNGMPLGVLTETTQARVLVIGSQTALTKTLEESNEDLDLQSVRTSFEAGSAAVSSKPHCVVLDTQTLSDDVPAIVKGLRSVLDTNSTIVGLLNEDTADAVQDLFDESFRAPFDLVLITTRIESLAKRALNQ